VVESNNQAQSQRDYLPSLDILTNEAKQQSSTLYIGTHILRESSKDNTQSSNQTHYQLASHLQSNTLELNDKAQTLSYEHYYPYGGTALYSANLSCQYCLNLINCHWHQSYFGCYFQLVACPTTVLGT
jgi:hypothetical protein